MKCEEYQQHISEYIDHELGRESEQTVFAHLATCEDCRGFFRTALRLRAEMTNISISVPESLNNRIHVERKANGIEKDLLVLAWRKTIPLPVAASIAMLLLAGSLLFVALTPNNQPVEQASQEMIQPAIFQP